MEWFWNSGGLHHAKLELNPCGFPVESQRKPDGNPIKILVENTGIYCGGIPTGILPLVSLWLHALLHPIMVPCFHSGSPKNLGDYFSSLYDFKRKSEFIYM